MKKQLLQESEIRKMMKFANIGELSSGFVNRLNEQAEMEPDEEDELGAGAEPAADDMMDEPVEDPMADPMADPDAEGDLDAPAGGEDEILERVADAMENFKLALELAGPEGQKAASMLEIESEESSDEDPPPPDDEALGGDPPMDIEMTDEPADPEAMVSEVTRRVARRLRRL